MKSTKASFSEVCKKIKELNETKCIKVLVMNADSSVSENEYKTGANIVIGGNVLGRGVTFPKLQTLYYTRSAKNLRLIQCGNIQECLGMIAMQG